MIIVNVKLSNYVNIRLNGKDMNEIQDVVASHEVQHLMNNPMGFLSYLELNDPAFMSQLFDHLDKDDIEGFRKNVVEGYEFTNEMYVRYLANAFGVHSSQITIALEI